MSKEKIKEKDEETVTAKVWAVEFFDTESTTALEAAKIIAGGAVEKILQDGGEILRDPMYRKSAHNSVVADFFYKEAQKNDEES